jgi:NAD(P)-dependent dehydrogenase (short-subunit alcohol dehydrogenase family)
MDVLAGKTAVVTGAASGIGLGMTEAFANRGMNVVMADVEESVLEAQATRLQDANLPVTACLTDVTRKAHLERLLATTVSAYGNVHVLCNNAGVGAGGGPLWKVSEADWQWIMSVNLDGVVAGIRTFVPHMLAHGEASHVVNTSSIAGMMTGGGSVYSVSKHAVTRLSEGLFFDLEAAAANIGVTCLCPGIINTNIIRSDRNRPADLPARDGLATLQQRESRGSFERYFEEQGMAPRQAGELVADAILTNKFYLFTQDEFMPRIKSRFDSILAETNPVSPGALPTTLRNDKGVA